MMPGGLKEKRKGSSRKERLVRSDRFEFSARLLILRQTSSSSVHRGRARDRSPITSTKRRKQISFAVCGT